MSEWNPTFTFTTEDGQQKLTYSDYLKDEYLRKRIVDHNLYRLFLGRWVFLIDRKALKDNKELYDNIRGLEEYSRQYPIAFFCPSGKGGLDFLNDTETDIKAIVAPNRTGKSVTGIVDDLLDLIPCNKDWPIFTEFGVKYRPWTGPKNLVLCTYQLSLHKSVIWPELRKWIPLTELGAYATGNKKVAFDRSPDLPLKCGSRLDMRTYEQDQAVFESVAYHKSHEDEQGKEYIFDGIDERTRTKGHTPQHIFTLTPHKVEGRPDTGGGSWIESLLKGVKTKGHTVNTYHISIADVPDWIYPEKAKLQAYEKWVEEPRRTNNVKALREGRARYYGEWHYASGLVYDEWDRDVHLINPIPIPSTATLYRAIDHGTHNPTACLWVAVFPNPKNEEEIIHCIYRCYSKADRTIEQNVIAIIEASGNKRKKDDSFDSDWDRWIEVHKKERYAKSVLDSRSFATKDSSTNREMGWLYKAAGLFVSPASGKHFDHSVPVVKDMLRVRDELTHPITGEKGGAMMYVFDCPECEPFLQEIEHYIWEEYNKGGDDKNVKERPKKKNDHLMSDVQYICQIPMRYYGEPFTPDVTEKGVNDEETPVKKRVNRRKKCGY